MNLTLNRHSNLDLKDLYSFFELLNNLISRFHNTKHLLVRTSEDFKYLLEVKKNRRLLNSLIVNTEKDFSSYSEKTQVEIELLFYKALKELEILIPAAKEEVKRDSVRLITPFLNSELDKTLKIFKKAQTSMSNKLYKDNSQEILANPEMYKELVDTWGDLAKDEY